jgi:hypothetical protein
MKSTMTAASRDEQRKLNGMAEPKVVIPAQAGIQNKNTYLDSCFHRNDNE